MTNALTLTLAIAALVCVPVGLKVLILYRWHRAGLRWPHENIGTYIQHSPRFEDGVDTETGVTVEEYLRARGEDPGEFAGEVQLRP